MSFESRSIDLLMAQADFTDQVDDTGAVAYLGFFKPGNTSESAACAKLIKIEKTGAIQRKLYASGNENYDKVINDRALYTYSYLK
jgi:hypothetical protein